MTHRGRVEIYPDWFGTTWLPDNRPPWPLPTRRPRRRLGILLGWYHTATMLVGLLLGVVTGLAEVLVYLPLGWPTGGLASVWVDMLLFGLAGMLLGTLQSAENAATERRWSWSTSVDAIAGLLNGLLVGWLIRGWAGESGTDIWILGMVSLLAGAIIGKLMSARDAASERHGSRSNTSRAISFHLPPAEKAATEWRWSWPAAGRAAVGGLIGGVAFGLVSGLAVELTEGTFGRKLGSPILGLIGVLLGGLIVGLIAGLVLGLFLGLINGWQPDTSQPPTRPGQALRKTLRTHLARPVAVTLAIVVLSVPLMALVRDLPKSALFANVTRLAVGLGVFVFTFTVFWRGIGPWLDHRVARFVAWWAGFLPRDLLAFLDYADERVLLRRSGGSYLFLHRTLRDYLATQDPESRPCSPTRP
ncbi:hypothetical protein C3Y87_00060 [Carbonactinospora thermoautotrophica]|nr:hypothetical protein [Carbonactinospora thermoautotrophica]MCX9189838.1 hypothetical protein [Carbonactinospora thermoautotrophica]